MSKTEPARKRKPAARRSDIVIALMEERLLMIPLTDEMELHRSRLTELLDELKRSLNKNAPESEGE